MKERELVKELIADGLMEGFKDGLKKRRELGLGSLAWCQEMDHMKDCFIRAPQLLRSDVKDLCNDDIWCRGKLSYSLLENEE